MADFSNSAAPQTARPRPTRPSTRAGSVLAHLRSLRPREVLLLVQMTAMVGALALFQRFVALPKLIRFFDVRRPRPTRRIPLGRLAWLAGGLLRRIFGQDFCMPRSLVLFHFMRKWAYPVRLHFGIAKHGRALKGHAWVTLDGAPFAEHGDPNETFKTVYVYPG